MAYEFVKGFIVGQVLLLLLLALLVRVFLLRSTPLLGRRSVKSVAKMPVLADNFTTSERIMSTQQFLQRCDYYS